MDRLIYLHFDYPLNKTLQFKVEKDQGGSFGFRKFSKNVISFIEHQYGLAIENLDHIRFTTTDMIQIRKVSEITENQTVVCFLSDSVIHSIINSLDNQTN